MADLDTMLEEELDDVAKAEAAIMELSEELPEELPGDSGDSTEEAAPQEAEPAAESLDERLARLEKENDELRRHEAGLRSGLIENRQRAAAMQQERDALFESLSNIDQRLKERQAPQAASDGWLDEDADATPAAPDQATSEALKEIQDRFKREDAERQVRQTISQVVDSTLKAEADFRNQNPDVDYDDAVAFAEDYHSRQLTAQGYSKEQAAQYLQQQKLEAAYNVLSTGQSPAVALINYSRSLGWQPKAPSGEAAAEIPPQAPARATPPKTIQNAGRAPAKANQDNSLATLYKTDPAKFRRIAADPEAWAEYERRIAMQQGISQASF